MANFNYDNYFRSMMTDGGGYSFASPDANRDEYRLGLMNTSKGIISVFDGSNDGKLNLQEYIAKEKNNMYRLGYTQEDIHNIGQDFYTTTENDFNAIDVNRDGTIDYKEMANFIHLSDAQDNKNPDGTRSADGTVTVAGMHQVLNKAKQDEKVKELAYNYNNNNWDKLGEKGDIDPSKIRQQFSAECQNGYSSTLRFPEGAKVFVLDPNSGKLTQLQNGQIVPRSLIYGNNGITQNSNTSGINQQNAFQKLIQMLILRLMTGGSTAQNRSVGYNNNGYFA